MTEQQAAALLVDELGVPDWRREWVAEIVAAATASAVGEAVPRWVPAVGTRPPHPGGVIVQPYGNLTGHRAAPDGCGRCRTNAVKTA